jgi:hypothetical protein
MTQNSLIARAIAFVFAASVGLASAHASACFTEEDLARFAVERAIGSDAGAPMVIHTLEIEGDRASAVLRSPDHVREQRVFLAIRDGRWQVVRRWYPTPVRSDRPSGASRRR